MYEKYLEFVAAREAGNDNLADSIKDYLEAHNIVIESGGAFERDSFGELFPLTI